jgi:hypothetical protein
LYKQTRSLGALGKSSVRHTFGEHALFAFESRCRVWNRVCNCKRRTWAKKSKGDTSEIMSALLQFSNVRFAVIRLSSAKGSPERLVLAYPNEETLRGLIADTSIVGLGFSSRDEAACAAGAAVTNGATPCQADGVSGSHAEERLVHDLREQLAHRMKFSPIRRLATTIVQLGIAAAIFIFYSKNIVSATVRAVLAGSA